MVEFELLLGKLRFFTDSDYHLLVFVDAFEVESEDIFLVFIQRLINKSKFQALGVILQV